MLPRRTSDEASESPVKASTSRDRASLGAGHLWAIGYTDMTHASRVKDVLTTLAWDERYLILLDVAVLVRHGDGSFTLNPEAVPARDNVLVSTLVGAVAGLVVAAPLAGAAIGALLGSVGTGVVKAATLGIGDQFVRDVAEMMKPGTSALFVLDDAGDMDVILRRVRGLGGTVLKTNVDVERAKLIETALEASPEA
jgi:uncharacterized membrane protein